MAKKKQQDKNTESGEFIEIVNWKKAQPRMKGGGQEWMKLYTSLLDHDGFIGMDDSARCLIIALWLYAARTGLHILPADPKWLYRKIPLLRAEPDLGPLLEAVDAFGNPTPFIRYCNPPKAKKPRAKKSGRAEQSREEKREEKREETNPTGSKEKTRERKDGLAQTQQTEKQRQTEQPEEPENPKKSEVGPAEVHHVPKPARSARGPQSMAAVIGDRFPEHWTDTDAEAFGWEMVQAMGMPRDPHNLKIRSEWGAFASWWCNVKKSVPAAAIGELRAIAVGKGRFVNSSKAKSARNKSAVWFHIMSGELVKHGVRLPQKRAGP